MKTADLLDGLIAAAQPGRPASDGFGLVIDNFAGGGGASTGIEQALGRPIDVAINHDPEAVAMHKANHPATHHYCQSVWKADPLEVTGGRRVALAWFSPDCKHFSKAKGGKPRSKHIRDLAWVVVQWAERVKPDVIMLENVEEFRGWGPLDEDGNVIRERAGETFEKWTKALRKAGYRIEWRELRACDYGAPTSRKRFFMIARSDGLPIVWPEPTHGKPGSPEVESGERLPWRTAAEIIDWTIPCPSIFERARPLADATMKRIAAGIVRFVLNNPRPFIVPITHSGGDRRVHSTAEPVRTITTANRGELAFITPYFARTAHGDVTASGKRRGKGHHGTAEPFPTITMSRDSALISPVIVGCGGRRGQSGPVDVQGPYPTTTAKADACIVTASLERQFGRSLGSSVTEPMPTITAGGGGKTAVIATTLISVDNTSTRATRAFATDEPVRTITAAGGGYAAVAATMIHIGNGEREGQAPRVYDIVRPLGTVVAGGIKHSLVTAFLSKFSENSIGTKLDEPIHTVMAGAPRHAVVTAHIAQHNTERRGVKAGRKANVPLSTITSTGGHQQLVTSNLLKLQNNQSAKPIDEPIDTILAEGCHYGEVRAFLTKYYGNEHGGHAPDKPIGTVTTKERFGLVTVLIGGEEYAIADIGMRMLTPRELFAAQGFPPDYDIEAAGANGGKPLTKTSQIAKCGNSVCPDLSRALVSANFAQQLAERAAA